MEARKHLDIKDRITKLEEFQAREWLVKNIKGLGYKEASHFLRNVGYKNLAILDRHIVNLMLEHGYIEEKPKSLNRKIYTELENIFKKIADKLKMSMAELDMYMWYMKTGKVLK
jgi:N-glycosylase/DNA lyase